MASPIKTIMDGVDDIYEGMKKKATNLVNPSNGSKKRRKAVIRSRKVKQQGDLEKTYKMGTKRGNKTATPETRPMKTGTAFPDMTAHSENFITRIKKKTGTQSTKRR